MKAGSFPKDKVFFCDPGKLLPLARFLPQPKKPAGKVGKPAGRGYVFFLIEENDYKFKVKCYDADCSIISFSVFNMNGFFTLP